MDSALAVSPACAESIRLFCPFPLLSILTSGDSVPKSTTWCLQNAVSGN